MKCPAAVLTVLALMIPLHADVLLNSHFTDGPSHWQGDGVPIGTTNSLADPSDAPPGIVINLKADKWTKIYQTFTAPVNLLTYSITLTLSSDYAVIPLKGKDPSRPPLPPGLTDLPGYPGVNLDVLVGDSTAVLLMTEPNSGGTYPLRLDLNKEGPQNFTGSFVGSDFDQGKASIVIAFPPGEGTVTLTCVSLSQ